MSCGEGDDDDGEEDEDIDDDDDDGGDAGDDDDANDDDDDDDDDNGDDDDDDNDAVGKAVLVSLVVCDAETLLAFDVIRCADVDVTVLLFITNGVAMTAAPAAVLIVISAGVVATGCFF
jgi:hypothetical protein